MEYRTLGTGVRSANRSSGRGGEAVGALQGALGTSGGRAVTACGEGVETMRGVCVIVGVACLALVAVGPAAALGARQPSLGEREAITRTLPASFRRAPVECIFVKINVSTRNSRYALVDVQVINWRNKKTGCSKYLHDGFYIVKKTKGWRSIYEGSEPPPCSLRVPRDLTPCLKP
jgi:hypothetical protein